MKCEECGNETGNNRRRLCSSSCRRAAYMRNRPSEEKTCEQCSKKFVDATRGLRSRFCGAKCRNAFNNQRHAGTAEPSGWDVSLAYRWSRVAW